MNYANMLHRSHKMDSRLIVKHVHMTIPVGFIMKYMCSVFNAIHFSFMYGPSVRNVQGMLGLNIALLLHMEQSYLLRISWLCFNRRQFPHYRANKIQVHVETTFQTAIFPDPSHHLSAKWQTKSKSTGPLFFFFFFWLGVFRLQKQQQSYFEQC